jgi:uncharacterized protein YndB with AHSA1/START domain
MTDVIQRELELAVSLDDLWRAVTEPEWLQTWMADDVRWDLEPGGEARFTVDGDPRDGWVEDVRAPENGEASVVFWWQADGEPASRVALELSDTSTGSRLVVRETRPLELLDVVGIPLGGAGAGSGSELRGPAMVCA